jgi:hypothetical protein
MAGRKRGDVHVIAQQSARARQRAVEINMARIRANPELEKNATELERRQMAKRASEDRWGKGTEGDYDRWSKYFYKEDAGNSE